MMMTMTMIRKTSTRTMMNYRTIDSTGRMKSGGHCISREVWIAPY